MLADKATILQFTLLLTLIMLGGAFFVAWQNERRREGTFRREQLEKQHELESKKLELDEKRVDEQRDARWEARQSDERKVVASSAGAGSGGYIVVELTEKERSVFHDLLKGFEDYAKLKGYDLSFSIDASFEDRIAFKFTVKNDGVVVGPERVRRDFKEYMKQVQNEELDSLDNLPVVTSLEEHNLLVTLLKNRISFLQHGYKLKENAVKYYESLISNTRPFPALPSPSVVVHTGGSMDSRNYSAINSSHLLQGDSNAYADSSVNIGQSFNEKQVRVAQLDDVIKRLGAVESHIDAVERANQQLIKVKDELTDYPEPNTSAIKNWLERAKQLLATATLGVEVTEAAHKLFQLFGIA